MFAKLFETQMGQVVVMKQGDRDNVPEVRFFYEPSGLGVCSIAVSFDDDSWEAADEAFNNVTEEMALSVAQQLEEFS